MKSLLAALVLASVPVAGLAQQAAPSSLEELYLECKSHHEMHPRLNIPLPSYQAGWEGCVKVKAEREQAKKAAAPSPAQAAALAARKAKEAAHQKEIQVRFGN